MSESSKNLFCFSDWEKTVPIQITDDALWKMKVYRIALFLGDSCHPDIKTLYKNKSTFSIADQLNRAVGSISANIAEGYSRSTGKDRARFYEYALGSARESRDWIYKCRDILGEDTAKHHMDTLSEIIRLLLRMIPDQRHYSIREDVSEYDSQPIDELQ